MVSNAFDMSRKIANVMSLDFLSLALDISFSRNVIAGELLSDCVESHIGLYKECPVIPKNVVDGYLQASLIFLKRLVLIGL